MEAFWVVLGIAVLVLTLMDVFLTVLNYDEAGFMAGRLASWQWRVVRRVTPRLPRRWRPLVLREVTGLQVMITIVAWVSITILGYALICYGSMQGTNFKYTGGSADFASAMYFSAGQLATVGGTALLTPNTVALEALSIVESLTGVVLVSLTLTFLLGVYDVVSSLRSLSSQFYNSGRGVRDPLASLTPYFPGGQERSRSKINRQAESLIATVNETIRAGLGIWSSGRDVSAKEAIDFSRDVEKMTAQLRALSDTARAASLGPGAFDPGGVQNQLSRFWELVYHTKDFVTATELAEPAEAHVTADQWEYLTKQTSQNSSSPTWP
ncbi:potassium channel family protein [Aeromicrobium wangtongii]|uniref:potassium channel family protein n=1 Tax=Aeromicrobium wangtongii TaxID=2969247 RepID=UPI002016F5DD|nr:potassium channel family protein [Aeromicrobium wangtongii]MCL3819297.1 potassium channel family protein [Aeromicrobium wangtongii]